MHTRTLRIAVLGLALLFALSLSLSATPYDGPAVGKAMRQLTGALSQAQKAISAKDLGAAKTAFDAFGAAALPLSTMEAYKGTPASTAEWQGIWKEFLAAAKAGSEASTKKDLAGASAALDKIKTLMNQGHRSFR